MNINRCFFLKTKRQIMKKSIAISFSLLLLSLGVTMQSCKSTKANTEANKDMAQLGQMKPDRIPDISGTWLLKSLNGTNGEDIFPEKMPAMNVDFSTGRINGNGGCNSYNGPFTLSGGIFSAPDLAATMMMCPNANQEAQFFAMLAKPHEASIENGNILILSDNGKTVAEFIKGIDPNLLTGQWVLDQIENEDMKSLFTMDGKLPTLEFKKEDKRIAGNAGCNTYGAPYTVKGDELTVNSPVSTRLACPNMTGEGKFLKAITGTSTMSVTGNELILSKNGKITLKFTKQ